MRKALELMAIILAAAVPLTAAVAPTAPTAPPSHIPPAAPPNPMVRYCNGVVTADVAPVQQQPGVFLARGERLWRILVPIHPLHPFAWHWFNGTNKQPRLSGFVDAGDVALKCPGKDGRRW